MRAGDDTDPFFCQLLCKLAVKLPDAGAFEAYCMRYHNQMQAGFFALFPEDAGSISAAGSNNNIGDSKLLCTGYRKLCAVFGILFSRG